MKKTFKVVMLPTEKASNLFLRDNELFHSFGLNPQTGKSINSSVIGQHLYIISDDEIKEGDWRYNTKSNQLVHSGVKTNGGLSEYDKKIVATTDKSLTIGMTEGNIYYISLPQIPQSFIQAYIKAYNEGKTITEVDLEMLQLPTGDDLEEYIIKTRADNTVIIHQSKMYSREEVVELFTKYYSDNMGRVGIIPVNKWIEEYL